MSATVLLPVPFSPNTIRLRPASRAISSRSGTPRNASATSLVIRSRLAGDVTDCGHQGGHAICVAAGSDELGPVLVGKPFDVCHDLAEKFVCRELLHWSSTRRHTRGAARWMNPSPTLD